MTNAFNYSQIEYWSTEKVSCDFSLRQNVLYVNSHYRLPNTIPLSTSFCVTFMLHWMLGARSIPACSTWYLIFSLSILLSVLCTKAYVLNWASQSSMPLLFCSTRVRNQQLLRLPKVSGERWWVHKQKGYLRVVKNYRLFPTMTEESREKHEDTNVCINQTLAQSSCSDVSNVSSNFRWRWAVLYPVNLRVCGRAHCFIWY